LDTLLATVRIRRIYGCYDADRVINPNLAHSQAIGGMVGGIGMALLEGTQLDHRDGRIVNANMSDYLVPVNADIPALDATFLPAEDKIADPIGIKGLGELVIVGVPAAIANAVFNATGKRVTDLPGRSKAAHRVVNLHDVDARPIREGRLGKPVEFGYKAQVVDNADGVILDHTIELGNPVDAPQLAPAIERITRRTGRPPRAVTADRGYGLASVECDLHQLGLRTVAIPRMSKPGAARRQFEHRRAFRDKIKWRTGSEGRINHLKRSYGWNRTHLTGINGARTWCGHGVFAHNLVKISALAA
jgi:transposase, IS5 family